MWICKCRDTNEMWELWWKARFSLITNKFPKFEDDCGSFGLGRTQLEMFEFIYIFWIWCWNIKTPFVLHITLLMRLTVAKLKLLLRYQYTPFVIFFPRKAIYVSEWDKCELSEVVNVLILQIHYEMLHWGVSEAFNKH